MDLTDVSTQEQQNGAAPAKIAPDTQGAIVAFSQQEIDLLIALVRTNLWSVDQHEQVITPLLGKLASVREITKGSS